MLDFPASVYSKLPQELLERLGKKVEILGKREKPEDPETQINENEIPKNKSTLTINYLELKEEAQPIK